MQKRYRDFITALTKGTNEKKIEWSYLDENSAAIAALQSDQFEFMKAATSLSDSINFRGTTYKLSQSFSTWINGDADLIALLFSATGKIRLVVAPGSSIKNALVLDGDSYGELLTELLAIIHKQFPDPEEIVDGIISTFLN